MKKQISPKVFYSILAVFLLVITFFLYRAATDPLYHRDPDEKPLKFIPPGQRARPPGLQPPDEKAAPGAPGKTAPSSGEKK